MAESCDESKGVNRMPDILLSIPVNSKYKADILLPISSWQMLSGTNHKPSYTNTITIVRVYTKVPAVKMAIVLGKKPFDDGRLLF